MDMIAMTLKAMGLDPVQMVQQGTALVSAFEAIRRTQYELIARLEQIDRQQTAIMASMGLYVPVPDGETKALIEAGSKAWIDSHGGPVPDRRLPAELLT